MNGVVRGGFNKARAVVWNRLEETLRGRQAGGWNRQRNCGIAGGGWGQCEREVNRSSEVEMKGESERGGRL